MEISNLAISDNDDDYRHLYLYTGISCRNNGKPNSEAAITVCFNEDNQYTVTELISYSGLTNQQAELHSIELSLNLIKNDSTTTVITRSLYVIDCISKAENNKIVKKNKELVESITLLLHELRNDGKIVNIYHQSAVPNKRGNEIAQSESKRILTDNT